MAPKLTKKASTLRDVEDEAQRKKETKATRQKKAGKKKRLQIFCYCFILIIKYFLHFKKLIHCNFSAQLSILHSNHLVF